jgi:chorismate dehydratase
VTSFPILAGLRIGCVKYLNSKPLIHGYPGPVIFEHPSGLARGIAAGELDVALAPIFEALRAPHYLLANGAAIASDGPVYSVFLAHREPLKEIRTIALDPASRTSVHLVQVLLREYHGLAPECVDAATFTGKADAQLLIGNQAIAFRQRPGADEEILDLGAEWQRCTGLPFVYAPWLLKPGLPNAAGAAEELRALKRMGVARLPEILRAQTEWDAAFAERYLTRHIRFDLGEREKAGIVKFRELLTKHGFIAESNEPLIYV